MVKLITNFVRRRIIQMHNRILITKEIIFWTIDEDEDCKMCH